MTALDKPRQPLKDAQPFRPSKIAMLAMVLAMQPLVWTGALMSVFYMLRFAISHHMLDLASKDFRLTRQWWFLDFLLACCVGAIGLALVVVFTRNRIPKGRSRGLSMCVAITALFLGIVCGVFTLGPAIGAHYLGAHYR